MSQTGKMVVRLYERFRGKEEKKSRRKKLAMGKGEKGVFALDSRGESDLLLRLVTPSYYGEEKGKKESLI